MSTDLTRIPIDQDAVLKAVGLNVRDPNAQALLLTCQRYGLDPVLRHMCLIQGRPYVTRDGLLHVAHSSGKFDGIEVLETSENQTHYTAKVSVYRKDMSHPFTYVGRYPKAGQNKAYGPEMAVKCGEVMALRRAFNVALCAREEVWDHEIESVSSEETVHSIEGLVIEKAREKANDVTRKIQDNRSLAELIQAGVDKVNTQFEEESARPDFLSVYEVMRHLHKSAIIEGRLPEIGKVSQGRCHVLLNDFYRTPEGRKWIRVQLSSYLSDRLNSAREALINDQAEASQEIENSEVIAESRSEREPGEDG